MTPQQEQTHQVPRTSLLNTFSKKKESELSEKWLISGLEQGKYKMMPKSKKSQKANKKHNHTKKLSVCPMDTEANRKSSNG